MVTAGFMTSQSLEEPIITPTTGVASAAAEVLAVITGVKEVRPRKPARGMSKGRGFGPRNPVFYPARATVYGAAEDGSHR
ncbi:hypothetical protein G6F57_020235 [Rhizopus arrhizus]|nr:hypothetical protein G6F57_020235 [Rhizopus arrhizus]